jgi:hypothetical protein
MRPLRRSPARAGGLALLAWATACGPTRGARPGGRAGSRHHRCAAVRAAPGAASARHAVGPSRRAGPELRHPGAGVPFEAHGGHDDRRGRERRDGTGDPRARRPAAARHRIPASGRGERGFGAAGRRRAPPRRGGGSGRRGIRTRGHRRLHSPDRRRARRPVSGRADVATAAARGHRSRPERDPARHGVGRAARTRRRPTALRVARRHARRVAALLHRRRGQAVRRPARALQVQRATPAPVRRPGLAGAGGLLAAPHDGGRGERGRRRAGRILLQTRLQEIVRYAGERYITVVPEIDMPAHVHAATVAYPELGCGRPRPTRPTTRPYRASTPASGSASARSARTRRRPTASSTTSCASWPR